MAEALREQFQKEYAESKKLWKEKKWDAIPPMYTEDCVYTGWGRERKGRAALLDMFKTMGECMPEDKDFDAKIQEVLLCEGGNQLVERGEFWEIGNESDKCYYMLVKRKVGDKWLVHWEINSFSPPPAFLEKMKGK